jgi:hypothetical protein
MEKPEDHLYPRSNAMWNLTAYDVHQIKGQLQARRARIDAKHVEDNKALDAEFAELETLERVAASVALKYRPAESTDVSGQDAAKAGEESASVEAGFTSELQPSTVPPDGGGGPDPKIASRWRLGLRERPNATTPE